MKGSIFFRSKVEMGFLCCFITALAVPSRQVQTGFSLEGGLALRHHRPVNKPSQAVCLLLTHGATVKGSRQAHKIRKLKRVCTTEA